MAGRNASGRAPLQSPRLAEIVANTLRDRILNGEIEDGSSLPRQEDLMQDFGVSMPSIREAIRILESEGIITVLRGNIGGAIVHAAPVRTAAYTMAMVLQSRSVQLSDIAVALQQLEPVCASMCAQRRDRRKTVVKELRQIQKETVAARDDVARVTAAGRRFHEVIVEGCGSQTMIVLVGALEAIWSSHAANLAAMATTPGRLPESDALFGAEALDRYAADHAAIIDAIEEGDAERAASLSAEHLDIATAPSARTNEVVQASVVRSHRGATGPGAHTPARVDHPHGVEPSSRSAART